jgi:glycine/D-amino acid oxidase-like deaminating enzyme
MAFPSKQKHALMMTTTMMMMMMMIFYTLLGMAGVATAWQSQSTMTRTAIRMTRTSLSSSPQDNNNNDSGLSYSSNANQISSTPLSSAQSSPMVPMTQTRRRGQLYKDVVIIGGGLAGLSTALYLTQIDPERRITILDRNEDTSGDAPSAGNQASMAAAGMLAPNSERLPKGEYRDLCLASKRMYTDFVALVESMAQESGPEGHRYLWKDKNDKNGKNNDNDKKLEPWNVGYVASGGFLAPAFAGDNVATWAPPEDEEDESDDSDRSTKKRKKKKPPSAFWLDQTQVRELEPHLHPDVVGGWWFPEDTSVDARRLTGSLKAACVGAGVEFLCGSRNEVTSLDLQDGICKGVWIGSQHSKYLSAKAVLVANGAWMRNLLPVPLEPHKGQSLSLRMPADRPPILRRVLFGGDSYIVPKADGRIVLGATVEAGSFDDSVTPAGIMHVLQHALQLVPGLKDLPIEETWAGLRPTTPDKGPILGETPWENLFLAGGYWRNGVLLAPKTGHLLATLIANNNKNDDDIHNPLSEDDQAMLDAFAWDRFTSKDGGARMAANSRYAASMYPVHQRKSGTGIAASVGTELGSYSTARSAGEERSLDRKSLFGRSGKTNNDGSDSSDSETEDLFEKAAMMGREDADVFEGFGTNTKKRSSSSSSSSSSSKPLEKLKFYFSEQEEALRPRQQEQDYDVVDNSLPSERPPSSSASLATDTETETLVPLDGSADAITVGNDDETAPDNDGLESIYQSIRANKAKQEVDLPDQNIQDDRPDPGFRISHVDKKTGQTREIPPYTQPAAFFEGLEKEEDNTNEKEAIEELASEEDTAARPNTAEGSGSGDQNYDETTFDGYQEIFKANASDNRQDELNKMKEARVKNRSSTPPKEVRKKD